MKDDLVERTSAFAKRIVTFGETLRKHRGIDRICDQLLGAGTGVGSNYRAARRARSRPEFVARLGVVPEEADEAVYWLTVIKDAKLAEGPELESLLTEATELLKITAKAVSTARHNLRQQKATQRNRRRRRET